MRFLPNFKFLYLIVVILLVLDSTQSLTAATPGFRIHRIDDRIQNTACAIGPDGHLYVVSMNYHERTGSSKLIRYLLKEDGQPTGKTETVYDWGLDSAAQPIGFAFDPYATKTNLTGWIALGDSLQGHSGWSDQWAGRIYKAYISSAGSAQQTKLELKITNLPHAFHTINNIEFGPDNRLYICSGSTTTLGWEPHMTEVLLSAAMLQADVHRINGVLDVKTSDGGNYNPFAPDALLKLYGTAIRQPYDCTWHPNGRLYACTNQNDVNGNTGAGGGIPNVANVRPPEFLAIIEPDKTYGFPNASRGEFVLMGGNPTTGEDGWTEIKEYPVGINPPETFDTSLLHKIDTIGGGSANGILSYRAPGELNDRIICCFYSAEKIYTFTVGDDGRVIDREPLHDDNGKPMVIQNPLDITEHPTHGHLYVAAFGKQDKGEGGAVYFLERTEPLQPEMRLQTVPQVIMGTVLENEMNWTDTFTLSTPIDQNVQYELSVDSDWIKITPTSGNLTNKSATSQHRVQLTKALSPDTYYTTIQISSQNGIKQTVSMNLLVKPVSNKDRFFVSAGNSYDMTAESFPVELPLNGTVLSSAENIDLSVQWEVEKGNPENIMVLDSNSLVGTVQFSKPGAYRLRLTAKQGERTRQEIVAFTVDVPGNQPPTMEISQVNQTLKMGKTLNLSATAEDDGLPEGETVTYQWTREGTGAGIITFSESQRKTTDARFSEPGPYRIRCTVSDGVRTAHKEIEVYVRSE